MHIEFFFFIRFKYFWSLYQKLFRGSENCLCLASHRLRMCWRTHTHKNIECKKNVAHITCVVKCLFVCVFVENRWWWHNWISQWDYTNDTYTKWDFLYLCLFLCRFRLFWVPNRFNARLFYVRKTYWISQRDKTVSKSFSVFCRKVSEYLVLRWTE